MIGGLSVDLCCTFCGDTTRLLLHGRDPLARQAVKRGWRIDRGAVVCKAHSHHEWPQRREVRR